MYRNMGEDRRCLIDQWPSAGAAAEESSRACASGGDGLAFYRRDRSSEDDEPVAADRSAERGNLPGHAVGTDLAMDDLAFDVPMARRQAAFQRGDLAD